jgi:hypothetical protein
MDFIKRQKRPQEAVFLPAGVFVSSGRETRPY